MVLQFLYERITTFKEMPKNVIFFFCYKRNCNIFLFALYSKLVVFFFYIVIYSDPLLGKNIYIFFSLNPNYTEIKTNYNLKFF